MDDPVWFAIVCVLLYFFVFIPYLFWDKKTVQFYRGLWRMCRGPVLIQLILWPFLALGLWVASWELTARLVEWVDRVLEEGNSD